MNALFDLTGQVALIIGASKGLDLEMARALDANNLTKSDHAL